MDRDRGIGATGQRPLNRRLAACSADERRPLSASEHLGRHGRLPASDSGVRLSQLATMRRFSSSDPAADHIQAFPSRADCAHVTAHLILRSRPNTKLGAQEVDHATM